LIGTGTGLVTKNIDADFIDLAVEQAKWNIHRASILTQSAVNASAGHVYGSNEMKDRYFRRQSAGSDKVSVFQAALYTETDRTDVPASITLDAFLKLIHPPG